jgi:hypothetical protein
MRAHRLPAALLLLPLLALFSGCGSTVAQSGLAGAAAGSSATGTEDGLGGPSVAGPTGALASDGAGTAGGRLSAGRPVGALRDSGATSQGSASVGPAAGGPGTAAGGTTRGVTATTVTVGVAYQANLDSANRALGGDKITSGDQKAEATLLVKDINSHGGLGGRRVVADFFAYDAQSAQPYDAQDQAACAHFTQDVKVFAVIGAGLTPNFEQCMERAGTAVLGADIVRFDSAEFSRYPHFFDVQEIELGRLLSSLADALAGNGYFTGWDATLGRAGSAEPTVGVVAFDDNRFRDGVRKHLLPALSAHGVPVSGDNIVFVQQPASQSDLGSAATQLQSAVLRFRQNKVDHVVLVDTHAGITQVFLNYADSQHYYPRYGMESGSGAQALLDGGIISGRQLTGTVGFGWIPSLDLPADRNPDDGPYSGPDRRRCVSIMKAGGQSFTSTNAESIALLYCDQFWLLERAVGPAHSDLSLSGLRAGVEALGAHAPAASLGRASYSSDKHYGPARGYGWSFDATCSCMAYSARAQTIE